MMNSYPHPVLSAYSDSYAEGAGFLCDISTQQSKNGVDLKVDCRLINCADLSLLIKSETAEYCVEVRLHGKGNYFVRVFRSSTHYLDPFTLPEWVSEEGSRISITGRIISTKTLNHTFKDVVHDLRGISFELHPGTILAESKYECLITPGKGTPLVAAMESDNEHTSVDMDQSPILLKIPRDLFEKLKQVPISVRDSPNGVEMIKLAVLVEALAKIRYEEDCDQVWATTIRQAAGERGVDEEDLKGKTDMSLLELAERIFDSPVKNSIMEMFQDHLAEEKSDGS